MRVHCKEHLNSMHLVAAAAAAANHQAHTGFSAATACTHPASVGGGGRFAARVKVVSFVTFNQVSQSPKVHCTRGRKYVYFFVVLSPFLVAVAIFIIKCTLIYLSPIVPGCVCL